MMMIQWPVKNLAEYNMDRVVAAQYYSHVWGREDLSKLPQRVVYGKGRVVTTALKPD